MNRHLIFRKERKKASVSSEKDTKELNPPMKNEEEIIRELSEVFGNFLQELASACYTGATHPNSVVRPNNSAK